MPTVYRVNGIDIAHEVRLHAWELIVAWQKRGGQSVAPAIVVGNPECASLFDFFWDDPQELMGYVVSWGPDGQLNAYTAWRALRPVARHGRNTVALIAKDSLQQRSWFQDETAIQEPDGTVLWGDNREAAACILGTGPFQQLVGVYGMPSLALNDWLAHEVARHLESWGSRIT